MIWDALNPRKLSRLRRSLAAQHAALERIVRRLERAGVDPSTDPLLRHLVDAADAVADARFVLRSHRSRRSPLRPGRV